MTALKQTKIGYAITRQPNGTIHLHPTTKDAQNPKNIEIFTKIIQTLAATNKRPNPSSV